MFWLSLIKLALEVFKAIKGVPDEHKAQVKSHLMDKINEIKDASEQGAKSGDYSSLEAIVNRTSG